MASKRIVPAPAPGQLLAQLWGERDAKGRGPKPALTLAAIVEAAIALADREGLSALSMQRVSSVLGFSAMALYRYVERKDDLLDLMLDHVMKPRAAKPAAGWREALEHWAFAEWAVLRRHPWALELVSKRGVVGPNRMGWLADAFAATTPAGMTAEEVLQTVIALDRYVRGAARDALAPSEDTHPAEQWWAAHAPFVEVRYPALAAALGKLARRFEEEEITLAYGIALILDGVEARLARKKARAPKQRGR